MDLNFHKKLSWVDSAATKKETKMEKIELLKMSNAIRTKSVVFEHSLDRKWHAEKRADSRYTWGAFTVVSVAYLYWLYIVSYGDRSYEFYGLTYLFFSLFFGAPAITYFLLLLIFIASGVRFGWFRSPMRNRGPVQANYPAASFHERSTARRRHMALT